MPTREDLLSLQERVANAKKALAELKKTPQPMSGDSWVMYRRLVKPTWDYEVHGITSTTYSKLYKVTYNVARPETGFMLNFTDVVWDDPIGQFMSYNIEPVHDDPYSLWMEISHVSYSSSPGGINIRFNIFSPQKGTLTVTEV